LSRLFSLGFTRSRNKGAEIGFVVNGQTVTESSPLNLSKVSLGTAPAGKSPHRGHTRGVPESWDRRTRYKRVPPNHSSDFPRPP
jgi:hypothetical protein